MRWIALTGIVFRSTAPDTPLADEPRTQRCPSTNTRTRFDVRLRRSISAAPAPMPAPSGGKPRLPEELLLRLMAEPEIAAGRLVQPFSTSLPVRMSYHLVSSPSRADLPKLRAFREWVLEESAELRAPKRLGSDQKRGDDV